MIERYGTRMLESGKSKGPHRANRVPNAEQVDSERRPLVWLLGSGSGRESFLNTFNRVYEKTTAQKLFRSVHWIFTHQLDSGRRLRAQSYDNSPNQSVHALSECLLYRLSHN